MDLHVYPNNWGESDRIMREEGAPSCGYCGKTMSPRDDHGNFGCSCKDYRRERELRNPILAAIRRSKESKLKDKTGSKK